jgi:uncharacterized protein YjiS (DUF1127 family)
MDARTAAARQMGSGRAHYANPLALHALAADGIADVATRSARPTNYHAYQAARVHRSLIIGEMIAAAINAVGAIARRARALHRRHREARAICDALSELDDHLLRDLGFDRSEIKSVAEKLTGEAAYGRARALNTLHYPPY